MQSKTGLKVDVFHDFHNLGGNGEWRM